MQGRTRLQRLPGPRTIAGSPGQPLVGVHCGLAALPTRAVYVPVLPWKEAQTSHLDGRGWPVLDAPLPAGSAAGADTHADELFDSNLARGAVPSRRQEDAGGRSPGAVSLSPSHSIGIAHAKGRDDNCGRWLHTRYVGFHQLLCAVPVGSASGQQGNAASHLAGAQSPGRRSDRPSMLPPLRERHSQRQELRVVEVVGEQKQTRSCAMALA